LFCGAIAILGLSGAVMGYGYVERNRKEVEDKVRYDPATKRQNKRTGWASIQAGVGVMLASIPLYLIITYVMHLLDAIYKAVVH